MYFTIALTPLIKIVYRSYSIENCYILIFLVSIAAIAQIFVLQFNSITDPELNSFVYYLGYNFVYALIGICLAYSLAPRENLRPANNIIRFLPIVSIIVIFSSSYFAFDLDQTNYLLFNLFLFLLFYYLSFPQNKLISHLAKISFGIYLSHHLFVELLQVLEAQLNWNTNDFHLTLTNFIIGTIISIVLSSILYKIPQTKIIAS